MFFFEHSKFSMSHFRLSTHRPPTIEEGGEVSLCSRRQIVCVFEIGHSRIRCQRLFRPRWVNQSSMFSSTIFFLKEIGDRQMEGPPARFGGNLFIMGTRLGVSHCRLCFSMSSPGTVRLKPYHYSPRHLHRHYVLVARFAKQIEVSAASGRVIPAV